MTKIGNSGDYLWNVVRMNQDRDVAQVQVPKIEGKKVGLEELVDKLNKVEKEEQIKNDDGTVTTVKTYTLGYTVSITKRTDKNGNEYEERIQRHSDGSLHAKTIKTNNEEKTEFYDKNGNIDCKFHKTFKDDGKTVKTDDAVDYESDGNGTSHIKNERHRYQNGDKLEIYYDGDYPSATVTTKENGKSVEKHYEMKGVETDRGNVKLDENGNIITKDGKEPRVTRKVTNPGLPTETTSVYTYNDDGSVEEHVYDSEGKEYNVIRYDSEEDFKKGITSLDKAIKELGKKGFELPKAAAPKQEQNKTITHEIQSGETLTKIAKHYGTTVDAIVKANGIKNRDRIYAGQTLIIPSAAVQNNDEVVPAAKETPADKVKPADAVKPDVQEDIGEDTPVGAYTEDKNSYSKSETADGFIDNVTQGTEGDCWLISGLNALSETEWGRDAIKNAMDIKDNGDIVITLKGAYGKNKKFTVTAAELEAAKNNSKYSKGDRDALAFELAIEKYRHQFGQTLNGGLEEEVFRLVTGSHNTQIIESSAGIRNLIAKAKANPEKYVISANFNIGSEDGGHGYNVSRFETGDDGKKYVILTNPWDSQTEIKITEAEFMKYCYEIQVLANPKGNVHSTAINSDGKIGNTHSSKDGWDKNVASAIYAVANENPQIIKDCIKKDNKGNLQITFKGAGKTYTVTPKEIAKAKDSGKYTQGDDDVIALEIAMEKYGTEQWSPRGLAEASHLAGVNKSGTNLYSISDSRAIWLLTGQANMFAVADKDGKYKISDSRYSNGEVDPKLLAWIKKNLRE